MKKILCPTDFSNKSLDTYRFASNLALSLPADLILYHASIKPIGQTNDKYFKNTQDLPDEIEGKNRALLETWQRLKNSEVKEGRRSQFDFVIEEGFPLSSIIRFTEKIAIDLVVMHTKTEPDSKHEGVYIGSIGAQVVEDVKCPVLLLPKGIIYDSIKKLVYAIDLDSYSEECISIALKVAQSFKATISFLYMGSSDHQELNVVKSILKAELENGSVSLEIRDEDDFIIGINNFIDSQNMDMLIMERHRKNILDKLFSKSLINAMEKYAEKPLLILPVD